MHVIWKRPDGFQNALPSDFKRVALSNGAQLWLHTKEKDWYPFQISGDWTGQEQTTKLNRLVNLLDSDATDLSRFVALLADDDMKPNQKIEEVAETLIAWLQDIKLRIRGHTWELEIVQCALSDVQEKLKTLISHN